MLDAEDTIAAITKDMTIMTCRDWKGAYLLWRTPEFPELECQAFLLTFY